MRFPTLCTIVVTASLAGCTWVEMAPGGAAVRVVRAGDDLSSCTKRGEVSVSVKDSVAFYERNEIKVRDELETLARNEASTMSADTVQPKSEPFDGEQRFTAWRCDGAIVGGTSQPAATRPLADGEAETLPLEE